MPFQKVANLMFDREILSVSWNLMKDMSSLFGKKEAFIKVMLSKVCCCLMQQVAMQESGVQRNQALQLYKFCRMKKGERIVVREGTKRAWGVVEVVEPYCYRVSFFQYG